MSKKKPGLITYDLSCYNTSERLPLEVEQIVLNTLIFNKNDVNNVASQLNMSIQLVDKVYLKYFAFLDILSTSKGTLSKSDTTINITLDMLYDHLVAVRESNGENTKLHPSTLKEILSCTDRIISIKRDFQNIYSDTVYRLSAAAQKNTSITLLESGKIESDNEFQENQEALLEKIRAFKPKMQEKKVNNGNQRKRIMEHDLKTDEYKEHSSVKACEEAHSMPKSYLSKVIRNAIEYKDRYTFEYIIE